MSQADGINNLTRMELAYSGGSYSFNINPENLVMTQPHRSSVVKTQSTFVIDDFNDDVQTLKLSGTTGGSRGAKGEKAIMSLWKFLDSYANDTPSYGQAPKEALTFYNHTENYAFSVTLAPDGYTITRDVARPLFWNYDITFIVLGYAGQTIDPNTISGSEVTSRDTNKSSTPRQAGIVGPMQDSIPSTTNTTTKKVKKGDGYNKNTQSSKSKKGSATVTNIITGKKSKTNSPLVTWAQRK